MILGLECKVEWWLADQAASRMGHTLDEIVGLIEAGKLIGELLPNQYPRDTRSEMVWWVRANTCLEYMKQAGANYKDQSDDLRKPDQWGNRSTREGAPILYGMLDARDVAALEIRRAKFLAALASNMAPLDPLELARLRAEAAGDLAQDVAELIEIRHGRRAA